MSANTSVQYVCIVIVLSTMFHTVRTIKVCCAESLSFDKIQYFMESKYKNTKQIKTQTSTEKNYLIFFMFPLCTVHTQETEHNITTAYCMIFIIKLNTEMDRCISIDRYRWLAKTEWLFPISSQLSKEGYFWEELFSAIPMHSDILITIVQYNYNLWINIMFAITFHLAP